MSIGSTTKTMIFFQNLKMGPLAPMLIKSQSFPTGLHTPPLSAMTATGSSVTNNHFTIFSSVKKLKD